MKRQNKILLGILGGATIGMLVLTWPPIFNYIAPPFGAYSKLIDIIGLIGGGYLGYSIGKRA